LPSSKTAPLTTSNKLRYVYYHELGVGELYFEYRTEFVGGSSTDAAHSLLTSVDLGGIFPDSSTYHDLDEAIHFSPDEHAIQLFKDNRSIESTLERGSILYVDAIKRRMLSDFPPPNGTGDLAVNILLHEAYTEHFFPSGSEMRDFITHLLLEFPERVLLLSDIFKDRTIFGATTLDVSFSEEDQQRFMALDHVQQEALISSVTGFAVINKDKQSLWGFTQAYKTLAEKCVRKNESP
jgi:hypothetical protein